MFPRTDEIKFKKRNFLYLIQDQRLIFSITEKYIYLWCEQSLSITYLCEAWLKKASLSAKNKQFHLYICRWKLINKLFLAEILLERRLFDSDNLIAAKVQSLAWLVLMHQWKWNLPLKKYQWIIEETEK